MSEPNTGELFSSLLSNPAMLSGIAKLLSSQSRSTSSDSGAKDTGVGQSDADSTPSPDMSGILSAALSNPQLLAALPKMLETLSSAMHAPAPAPESDKGNDAPAQSAEAASLSSLLPALSGGGGGYKKPPRVTDRRSALLMALKPYMSHDKAEMIDTIVRIIEIMSIIK